MRGAHDFLLSTYHQSIQSLFQVTVCLFLTMALLPVILHIESVNKTKDESKLHLMLKVLYVCMYVYMHV